MVGKVDYCTRGPRATVHLDVLYLKSLLKNNSMFMDSVRLPYMSMFFDSFDLDIENMLPWTHGENTALKHPPEFSCGDSGNTPQGI